MTNADNMTNETPTPISQNAVSVYGQSDAMDDFPVLKAFQQYIDSEQAKAQKRMTVLCVFFALILVMVIGVFVMLLMNISRRNETLNDQLISYMMRDRDSRAGVVMPARDDDRMFKAMAESMAAFQKQLSEQQLQMSAQQSKILEQQNQVLEEQSKKMSETSAARDSELAIAKKNKEDAAKLKKALEEIKAQREQLERDKREIRKMRVEDHYRRERERKAVADDESPSPDGPAYGQDVKSARRDAASGKSADSDLDDLLGLQPEVGEDGAIKYFDEDEESAAKDSRRVTTDWQFPLD